MDSPAEGEAAEGEEAEARGNHPNKRGCMMAQTGLAEALAWMHLRHISERIHLLRRDHRIGSFRSLR